ncbi:hypothetical protein SAY86_002837 [Trapa natans]|uniref:Uncharacterized protein n=1 Tax=Trapa natans TaxID=22666 RepID=A0AAN7LDY7_TRANT|nr:hypothetical protein SAY86_002837 [Trapa natans]
METPEKRVLMTSNGDDISINLALHLAKRGCRLVLMGDERGLTSIVQDRFTGCRDFSGSSVEVVGLDMEEEREAAFEEAVDKACNLLGNLDAFVNYYTYEGKMQDPLQVAENEFKKVVKINFASAWSLLRAVGRRLRDNRSGGSIVFLTSIIGGERGIYPGSAIYASSMAGVQQLVRASAMELGKYKIRVNAIARGLHLEDEYPKAIGQDRARRLVKNVAPLNRWLDPKRDLASTVVYLISHGSRFMTGTTTYVDGAQSIVCPRIRSYM